MGDELLDLLARQNPVPERMAALSIDDVWARLDSEPNQELRRSAGGSGMRRAARALPVLASVAVVAVVTALLLTTGGRSHSAGRAPGNRVHRRGPRPRANPFTIAKDNVHDTPLQLFRRLPQSVGIPMGTQMPETVIASSVRRVTTFPVPGVGPIQYWAADTRQHGICTALRLSSGDWDGLQYGGRVSGTLPGCRPTRAQTGRGALILDGFDYLETMLSGHGKSWTILYGIVSVSDATRVRETVSGVIAPVVGGHYFAIVLKGGAKVDWGDNAHLVALDARGHRVAVQGRAQPGTPTTECVGRYDVHRVPIPHSHRTALLWKCRSEKTVLAK